MGLVGFESAPRYRELLYKLISEDLEFPPAGFILESDRPEWSFLKDEILWSTQVLNVAAAGAGLFGFFQVFNPAGSGRIVVVQGAFITTGAAWIAQLALTTTVRGATGGAFLVAPHTRWNSPIT